MNLRVHRTFLYLYSQVLGQIELGLKAMEELKERTTINSIPFIPIFPLAHFLLSSYTPASFYGRKRPSAYQPTASGGNIPRQKGFQQAP